MNPAAILLSIVVLLASAGGVYIKGRADGRAVERDKQQHAEDIAVRVSAAAASAVADGLSKLEIKNVTIQKALEREVITREVFRDCRSGDSAVRLLNATPGIAHAASAPDGGELPAADPAR